MTKHLSPSENIRRRLALLFDKNVDGWVDQYADDAVHEFPFAPAGRVTRLEGRNAIAAYMRHLPDFMSFEGVHDLVVYETADAQTITAEFRMNGRVISTGAPFNMNYVWVITFYEGKIVRFRDYMNPLALPVRDQSSTSKPHFKPLFDGK